MFRVLYPLAHELFDLAKDRGCLFGGYRTSTSTHVVICYPSGVVGVFICSCFRVFVCVCVCVCVCLSRLSYTWSYVRVDFVLSANRISHVPQYSVGQNQESIIPYE